MQRLISQQILAPVSADPAEIVRRLGAVQAQEYRSALWAVGLRTVGATRETVEQALNERRIVSTWPMRGTIHFVAAEDVRWMLALLTPRVIQRTQGRYRQLGLDEAVFTASAHVLSNALAGGQQLSRPEISKLLEAAGIVTTEQRGYHILCHLAQTRLICFASRSGSQPTFALLDEWVTPMPLLPREEALATLALRYVVSHGPVTVQDFVWWSGLSVAEAKQGLAAVKQQLETITIGEQIYFLGETTALPERPAPFGALLPPFDEFLIAYRDRSAILDQTYSDMVVPGGNGVFKPIIVIDGRVVGTWQGLRKGEQGGISYQPFGPLNDAQLQALPAAAAHYERFISH
jgi:hypothetical protein